MRFPKGVTGRPSIVLVVVTLVGCSNTDLPEAPAGVTMKNVELKSTAFANGEAIPKQHTGDGENVSPPLSWSTAPEGTKSWAMVCDDPDAPVGTWVHWVIFNLPPNTRELSERVPTGEKLASGAMQGKNDFGKHGYGGPAPPKGKPHRYFFKLYALDTLVDLKPGATKAQLLKAADGHVLGHGELMGKYQR
jgi:Raf kinase inhibitor-like YbhB/YbcL family protein